MLELKENIQAWAEPGGEMYMFSALERLRLMARIK